MAILWQPTPEAIASSQMTTFQKEIESRFELSFESYSELHQWTIDHTDDFWSFLWEFCNVKGTLSGPTTQASDHPWGVDWFPNSRLNFAENLLPRRDDKLALVGLLEDGQRDTFTYQELFAKVVSLANVMQYHGIQSGDRVAGLMPNIPQTVIAMLAATSLGAIWSSCSPDFGARGACDRFSQIQPKLLFTTNGYLYNGKRIDVTEKASEIWQSIDSIKTVVEYPLLEDGRHLPGATSWDTFIQEAPINTFEFPQLPFNHPLYIMYSSGTTGVPKCIVHGAGGTLLQHLKEHKLHVDLHSDDTLFYFTTCGWMMWNWLISGLATGATLVLYDGSPFSSDGEILLDAIDNENITVFGTSAKYIAQLEKIDKKPRLTHQLSSLRTILSTGSPLNHSSFEYVYRDIKSDVHLASISGGTDIISCFALGNPNLPVHTGELQCAGLGMATEFWVGNEAAAKGEQGELVCTAPFPSAPIGFWNDVAQEKFRAAYFDARPGIWTHGDFGELTESNGYIIHGRSDATLNPSGVRIGTAEIYRQIETLPEVVEGIVVGQEWQGDERIILFVVLSKDTTLNEALESKIKLQIRSNTTPRHVPAKVVQVLDIPRTMSGKIVELAVRDIIHGKSIANEGSLANPEALEHFKDISALQED